MVRDLAKFKEWLRDCGAEILGTTSDWEVLRVRTHHGVLVAHRNKRNRQIWPPVLAELAIQFERGEFPALSAAKRVRRRSKLRQRYQTLVERDGPECFYCGEPVPALDEECEEGYAPSVEHLVPNAHGGPNHISNSFLAHACCNNIAGALSAVEKIRLREQMRGHVFNAG